MEKKKTSGKEVPKLRVASAKAGTAKKCDVNYFPPENSVSRNTLVAISEAGEEGMPVYDYPLSEMFLGRLVRCGLVASDGVILTATERTNDILEGKLELPSTRGSEINKIITQLKNVTDAEQYQALLDRLAELKDDQIGANAERIAEKEAKEKEEAKPAKAGSKKTA